MHAWTWHMYVSELFDSDIYIYIFFLLVTFYEITGSKSWFSVIISY
jgi:hypothetical protein